MLSNLNSVLLKGKLTTEPEGSYTNQGTLRCKFSLASEHWYKQDDVPVKEVSTFEVVAWSKTAEICLEHLSQGKSIRLVGRLKQLRWSDRVGNPKSKVIVTAEHIEFKPSLKEG